MNSKSSWRLAPLMILLGLLILVLPGVSMARPIGEESNRPEDKIEPLVLEQLNSESETDFFIWMTEKADLSQATALKTKTEKGEFVFNTLRETAERTQKDVRTYLDQQQMTYRAFYIANKIYVHSGNLEAVLALAAREDVAQITANHPFQLQEPFINPRAPETPQVIEPNISFVNADDVWALGYTGTGIVLAGNDTGLYWNHPALINQYRGWNGSTADHNYNWWDATGTYPTVPNDGHGHGTHTTGTMVGDDGVGNQIGVAPGAKTIHCKNMTDGGGGNDLTFTTCFEWDLAPWDLSGNNPNPALAPHAINNSWGYGGGNAPQFEDEIAALRAAGIVVEVSAGNEGSSCGSLRSPGDYAQSLTTGSVNHISGVLPGTLTGFSSRGPSALYPGEFFPDIMAPGENIRSSVPGGGYQGGWSGTSMSGPHVTALVALMWDASPNLEGDVISTEQIMVDTAVPLTGQNGSNCGGDYTTGPNNDWGYGTMDALAAVQEAIIQGGPFRLEASPASLAICAPANAVYTIDVLQNDPTFTDPVTLAATGNPGGTTVNFSVNPVTPPGSSNLTIGSTGSGTPGNYNIAVTGMGPTTTQTVTVGLDLFNAVPGALTLVAPANGATNVDLRPMYQWTAASQAGSYFLEVAEDNGFGVIVYTATTNGTSHQPNTPLDPLTTYYWRVTASNACGTGTTSSVFSFETRDIPPILLVDDDDNNPDVRSYYTDALDALGAEYDVWDTNNSDNEPSAAELAPYNAVIWFTGVEFGGAAGPGGAGEAALASWLDNGGCLFISSQDYLWDRGQTAFMSNYLGLASFTSDVGQTSVTGAGSVYSGLGPYSLSYPFSNYSDRTSPNGTAELAFSGNQGDAAINKDNGVYRTTFWGFPFEAISTATNREAAMQTTLNWCGALGPTGTLAGTVTDLDSSLGIPGATITAVGPGTFMATTNSSGAYSRVMPVGTYDVTASAPNYAPVTVNGVVITDSTTTVQNFQLQGSSLTYSPPSIEESMEIGDVVSNTVTVTNTGPLPIDWNVTIGNWSDPTALRIIPRSITTQDASDFSQPAAVGPASVRSPQGRSTLASQPATPFAWANGASMPSGVVRYGHTQCADQPDSYYVISGVDSTFSVTNGAWRYDANTDSWATLASIPTGQEGTAAVCYAGNIYVAGGGGTNQMFIYNIAGNSWSTGAAVPRNVWGAAMGAWDGKVYLIGGDSDFSFGGTSNQVNIYDITSNTWTGTGVNMPAAAVTAGSAQAGQYVYVVGGWGDASPGSNVNVTQRYDMSTNSWETGPTFTSARADLALAVTSSNLYAIAGDGNGGGAFDPVALVESLDHTAWPGGAWTNISDPLPTAVTAINGGFCTGAMAGGEIWAPGGYNGSAIVNANRYRPSESCFTGGTPWAYAVPNSGTIPANSTATFEVVFDAVSLYQVGDYTAELSFSGTFVNVVPSMPLTMHLSCPTCGFLEGDITDAVTGNPVNASVHITNTSGFDVTVSGSSYAIAVQPGTYYLAVSANGYLGQTGTAVITQGNTTVLDFALDPAIAILSYSPAEIEEWMEIGDIVTNTVTVTNTGYIDLNFSVTIGGWGGPSVLVRPHIPTFDPVTPLVQPGQDLATNTAGLALPQATPAAPLAAGDVLNSWVASGVPNPWGIAFDGNDLWISSPVASWGGNGTINRFGADGTPGGVSYPYTWNPGNGPADTAFNWNTGMVWIMDVGTGNCIHEINPATGVTGNTICPGFSTSQRGLAYDPSTDTYLAGGWNDLTIYRFASDGTMLEQVSVGLAIAGLAYNPDTMHLFVMVNASPNPVYVLDAANNYALVGQFNVSQGFADFSGAGLEFDCDGNLWAVDQAADIVYLFESGESASLCGGGWAYAVPDSGTVPPMSSATFDVVFDASSLYQVGDYTASLSFSGNFVNVVPSMPLTMHLSCPSCGFLEGDITDAWTNAPLNADIHVTGPGGFDVTLSGSSYALAVQPGTYDFVVSANGYFDETASVTVAAGQTVVTDFALTPIVSILEYSPASFERTIALGQVLTDSLDIHNAGTLAFNFELSDNELGRPTLAFALISVPAGLSAENAAADTAVSGHATGASPARTYQAVRPFSPTATNVLIACADDSPCEPLGSILQGYPDIGIVNVLDVRTTTPTLGDLLAYDVVVTWSNYSYADPTAMGNVLADYVDAGGAVIHSVFNWYGSPFGLAGRFMTGGYTPLISLSSGNHFSTANLGAYDPSHPIMAGVTSASDYFRDYVNLDSGATLVASWDDGEEFVATKGRVVGINSYTGTYYMWTGDMGDIFHNAINYVGLTDALWLTQDPATGTVNPGDTETVNIIFDTAVITQTGTYTAEIRFAGTFGNNVPAAQVVMHVIDNPTFGVVVGADPDAQSGDPGDTVAYTVWITNTGNIADIYTLSASGYSWDTTLSANSILLDAGESDSVTVWVDIPANATGSDTVTVEAASTNSSASGSVDLTTSVNFAMTMSGNMTGSGAPGSTVMYAITITNTGGADDTYNLSLGTHNWTAHLPGGNSVNVAAGASATVMLHVTIPASATHGQSDAVTVTVTSTHDSSVTGSATMTTTAVVTSYTIYLPILMKP